MKNVSFVWSYNSSHRIGTSTYLAFRVCPKFHNNRDQVVECSVGALICQDGRECGERKEGQACLEAPMYRRSSNK